MAVNIREMERMWTFRNAVNIVFGTGALESLGDLVGGRDYALVTYGEPVFQAIMERTQGAAGPARIVINNVTQNPDFSHAR